MPSAYYYGEEINKFEETSSEDILKNLLLKDEFETTDLQKNAWIKEIEILKDQLAPIPEGAIILEYTIPRIGSRIDTVLILQGVLFLIEFKVNSKENRKSTQDQVMDYALDLKYFHEKSKNRIIVPITCETESAEIDNAFELMEDNVSKVLLCNKRNLNKVIRGVLEKEKEPTLDYQEWIASRYAPTPTIIEAAQVLYRNHTVDNISRNDAGAENLTETTCAINEIINRSKKEHRKAICFVTGVPGAGKTLAGLNIANSRHDYSEEEHAVFLSGNGPLVDVLQEALARDQAKREGKTKKEAKRKTQAFIQIVHKFRDAALENKQPPIEKVAIFDEAQRAWDETELTNFMETKKGVSEFNLSEPEFLISIMNRHQDWAVIICLVGGGQEIYKGEGGMEDWFKALRDNYKDWNIYLSSRMCESEYVGKNSIEELLNGRQYASIDALHLGVSLRSFRSEQLSSFVKSLLDNDSEQAKSVYDELSKKYPIVITRDFEKAKEWVKNKARGSERYGLLASSEGKRLRAEGIWVPSTINHVGWFLNGKDNVDSSYYLEVAASEFKVQGLEVDYALLAWDADFRYENGQFTYHKFRGTSWNNVNKENGRRYMKNAYRVLLTRARQGLVIYIPEGNEEDMTTVPSLYNGTYQYLKSIGIEEI